MSSLLTMPLRDADARERALDVRTSFIVEAPAGSGKTGLLIQRFLRLLAEGEVQRPEEVMAITFTRKATGEMRERLLQALRRAAQPADEATLAPFELTTRRHAQAVLARDAALGWHILDQPQTLNIRTIDSLCHQIAGHLPVLSGLGGRLQPVDDGRALYAEAAQQTLEDLGSSDTVLTDALHTLLLHRDGRLSDCTRLIASMLGQREQWARLIPSGDELTEEHLNHVLRPRMEAELQCIVVAALDAVRDALDPADLQELAELGHAAAHTLATEGKAVDALSACLQTSAPPTGDVQCVEQWRALSRILLTGNQWRKTIDARMGFPAGSPARQRHTALLHRVKTNDVLLEALNALSEIPPPCYTDEEWSVAKALFRVLRHAHARLRILFAARGQCDFSELSMASLEALESQHGGDELAAALGLSIRHLLVDEMQDTSLSQYKLLELLTQGWDGVGQTVFLVGDPRQSIYLFRQACVEQFANAIYRNRLGDIALESLKLTANFRSHPTLVAALNTHFAAIRPHQIHPADDSAHTFAEPGRSAAANANEPRLHWHTDSLPSGSSAEDKQHAATTEAEEIVRIVRQEIAGVAPSATERPPIAILVRAKNHAAHIANALRRAGIAYRATEIDALGRQPEVLDALSLLRALLHPADRVAWLALLRAPWCGLTLHDLHTAAGGDDPQQSKRCLPELLAERAALLSADGRTRAGRILSITQASAAQQGRLPMAQWLENAWRSLGAPLYLTLHQCSNVEAFFELLTACEERGETVDAMLLQERLDDLCSPESTAAVHVEISTIHKAKGLEWDVVILPALHRKGAEDKPPLLQYVKDVIQQQKPALFAPIPRTGAAGDSVHKYLGRVRLQSQRLELRRLFYVASTRARESLHLFAQPVATKSGISPFKNSLLHAAWPAAEPHFAAAPAASTMAMAAAATPGRTMRRIPSDIDPQDLFTQQLPAPLLFAAAPETLPQAAYQRAEGSVSARALGTVVHAYLERIAQEFAAGATATALAAALPGWLPGMQTMLRSFGITPAEVNHRAAQTLTALQAALADATGQWVLANHPQAVSELAISTWSESGTLATFRMDRIFRAGAAPLQPGEDYLWIVDFKISAFDEADAALFAVESEKHRGQLETYARLQQHNLTAAEGIRLAAFYPLRKAGEKLKVWDYEPEA